MKSTGNQSTATAAATATAIASRRWRSTRRLTTKKDNDEDHIKESMDHNKESTDREKREAQERRPSSLPYFWLANNKITEHSVILGSTRQGSITQVILGSAQQGKTSEEHWQSIHSNSNSKRTLAIDKEVDNEEGKRGKESQTIQ